MLIFGFCRFSECQATSTSTGCQGCEWKPCQAPSGMKAGLHSTVERKGEKETTGVVPSRE